MTPLPGKTTELIQTIAAIATPVKAQRGCLEFAYQVDDEGGTIEITQRWSDRAAADSYLGSREHRALTGAGETLCREHSLQIQ